VLRPTRRWTRQEQDAQLASAPLYVYAAPTTTLLNALAADYTRLTGEAVRGWRRRNLIASAYRVHGPDFRAFVADRFRETGTTTNLLWDVRCSRPRLQSAVGTAIATHGVPSPPLGPTALDCGCPVDRLIIGLVYCVGHRPMFDARDCRRHDRRASNPEAARFFPAETVVPGIRTGRES
jgi:hypothetical protein